MTVYDGYVLLYERSNLVVNKGAFLIAFFIYMRNAIFCSDHSEGAKSILKSEIVMSHKNLSEMVP